MTLTATEALEAWNKTLETQDFNHLGAIFPDSFNFVESIDHSQEKSETQEWVTAGIIRIDDFGIIRETGNYMVGTHSMSEEGKGRSTVMFYNEHSDGFITYRKTCRFFV
jgi:hypothetical protein